MREPYDIAKNVQLLPIRSRPLAFQRAKGKLHTLPLSPQRVAEKRYFAEAREAPQNFGVPLQYFLTAEASDSKFGMLFGFSKTHHKITPKEKSGRGRGLGELFKIWGSPLIFLQRLKVATSRLAGR